MKSVSVNLSSYGSFLAGIPKLFAILVLIVLVSLTGVSAQTPSVSGGNAHFRERQ